MLIDRNKTATTHHITAAAVAYLDMRGCKPIETEVGIGLGEAVKYGIADIASFVYPTHTEISKLKIRRFCRDEINGQLLTVVVEVKASRPDFQKDKKRKFKIFPANLCYLAYPKGLLKPDEVPEGWLGLEATKDERSIWRTHWQKGAIHSPDAGTVLDTVVSIAIKRDHRTRYRAMRDYMRAARVREIERKRKWQMADLFRDVVNFLEGKDCLGVEGKNKDIIENLRWYGLNESLFDKSDFEKLRELRDRLKIKNS